MGMVSKTETVTKPKPLTCIGCNRPVGLRGDKPAIKVGPGVYKHEWCCLPSPPRTPYVLEKAPQKTTEVSLEPAIWQRTIARLFNLVRRRRRG